MGALELTVDIDATRPLGLLHNGGKRIAFALANALNETAKHVQQKEHAQVRREFTVRQHTYFFGTSARPGGAAGRITEFASAKAGRFRAQVQVHGGSQASARRLLLPMFETGGDRSPRPGAKSIAVPITGGAARRSFRQKVDPGFTFAGMKLQAFSGGKRLTKRRRGRTTGVGLTGEFGRIALPDSNTAMQWKGRNRTFLLPQSKSMPHGGVLQRVGPKRGDIRTVYEFFPRVPIDRRLRFGYIFNAEAPPFLNAELKRQVKAALLYNLLGVRK